MRVNKFTQKVSVIIPVFNGERHLKGCLQSIENQLFENWEVICVDDGSSDSSAGIIESFVRKDSRYKIICQKNSGVSQARKRGLLESSGEYIIFCDCDDLLPERSLEILLDAVISNNADAAAGVFRKVPESFVLDNAEKINFQEQAFLLKDNDKFSGFCSSWNGLWSHIYKRDLFFNGESPADVWPDRDVKLGEDVLTNLELLFRAKKVAKTEAVIYFYRSNPDSVSSVAPWSKRNFSDGIRYLEELDNLASRGKNASDRAYISYLLLERLFAQPVVGTDFKKKYWSFLHYYLQYFVFAPTTQYWLFRKHRCAWIGAITGMRHFLLPVGYK